ncbi:MAG: YkgJ family cysteine cluster protein [Deltaproteobacteria bacterium]|nr:YkgJ family cysteine cluster protein [Deltaproteobacteria bacterium]
MNSEPDSKKISCLRCGKCCQTDMVAYATQEDIERWRAEKRFDILDHVETHSPIWAGDHLVRRDGQTQHGCPFLRIVDGHCECKIYETRPDVCRTFQPGSSLICPLHQFYVHAS